MDWDEEILGEMEGGYDNRRFSSYWNSDKQLAAFIKGVHIELHKIQQGSNQMAESQ